MLNLYPPSAFDAYKKNRAHYPASIDAACEEIHKACDGLGTDDKALVKILGPMTPNDRGLVSQRYKELHNQSLRDLIKSETSGDLGNLLQLISMSMPQAEAYILYHAMEGTGTSDHLLYTVSVGLGAAMLWQDHNLSRSGDDGCRCSWDVRTTRSASSRRPSLRCTTQTCPSW